MALPQLRTDSQCQLTSAQSRHGTDDAERVRIATCESGRQIDAQVITLLGPNKRICISQQVNFRAGLHRKGFERDYGRFRLPEKDRVRCGLLLREPDRNAFHGLAGSPFPGKPQGIEIPCSRPKIPCSCEKIPCSFGLREFGLQRIEITIKSPGFADRREFADNTLK